jgi:hypothetical protein
MKYTVLWKPDAEDALAALWISSPNREALTAAANEIDRLLRTDPTARGEPRSGGRRLLICPPLAVVFQVRESDRFVDVLAVRLLADLASEN